MQVKTEVKNMKKIGIILLCLFIIYMGYAHKTWFLETMKAGGNIAILASILFAAVLAFFPIVPFVVYAGIIGGVYGTWEGTSITLSGAMMGTMIMFFMSRYGFRDWASQLVQRYPKAQKYEAYFEEHGFVSVLAARLVPIIPTTVVNVVSGLSKISWIIFFLASTIGKMPVNLLYNLAGSELSNHRWISILIYVIYGIILIILISIYQYKEGKKK
jgi:uncharacterized membrane protein YdjX (TVP38/TMEM64 family)